MTSVTLEKVLQELSVSHKIDFSYSNDLVHLQQIVTVKAEAEPLHKVLDYILKETGITYTVIGSQIILKPGPTIAPNSKRKVTVSGYIKDAASGESLAGAVVSAGTTGTTTNVYGFFSLGLVAGNAVLEVRHLGYTSNHQQLATLHQDTTLTITLAGQSNQLLEVDIVAEKTSDLQQANRLSMRSVEIKQLPKFMGETDAVKALQMMPGVLSGREGSSDLIVRGGSPDQNLILLDGVPVYNVSHLLGMFSVFNPDAIKTVDLIKGGFPAPYGGRLSSIIDVQLKEGNNKKFSGEGALGLISSKLLLEGPIKNEKTSFLIAGRRTYLDLLTAAAAAMNGEQISSYGFYDLNAKVNHTFSPTNRLYLSMYAGKDGFSDRSSFNNGRYQEEQKFRMRWGNMTSALRWNHVYSPKLFSNLTFIYSSYDFNQHTQNKRTEGLTNFRTTDYTSGIKDLGVKADFDFSVNPKHDVRFGGSYTHHSFSPEKVALSVDTINLSLNSFSKIQAHEFYTYAEDQVKLGEFIQANIGLHYSGFAVNGKFYNSLQPRMALGYTSRRGLSVRTSFATMAQYLHLLSNTSTGTPTDIWVPATDKVKPQQSWQATFGIATPLLQNKLELTSDLYYKEMNHVAEFKDGADFIGDFMRAGPKTNFANFVAPPYETRIQNGKGWSYGSEWLLRKRQGKTTGWLAYTLAWSWRQLDSINFNQKYPYTYDSRHSIALVANHQLSENLSIGGSWLYRTGYVTTLPSASYKAYNEPVNRDGTSSPYIENVDHLGERNNYRMPAYHRLDLSLTHTKKKKWGERSWNVSVYNAYNRKNPYYLQLSKSWNSDVSENSTRTLYQFSLFPILPSFSYGFKF